MSPDAQSRIAANQQTAPREPAASSRVVLQRFTRWGILCFVGAGVVYLVVWSPLTSGIPGWSDDVQQLLNQARHTEAIQKLNGILASDPDDSIALLMLARAFRGQGDIAQAEAALDRLVKTGNSSQIVGDLRILLAAQSGALEQAQPHLARLLTESQLDSRETCEAFVIGYRSRFRFEQADTLLQAWEQDWPQDFRPAAHRGLMAQTVGRWKFAVEQYQSAVAKGDWRPETHLQLGLCQLEINQHGDAVDHFEVALRADPDNLEALLGLAHARERLGELDLAAQVFQDCLQVEPANDEARLGAARVMLAQGDAENASRQLAELLDEWPEDRDTLYQYGQALAALGREDEAEQVLDKWSKIDLKVQQMEEKIDELRSRPQDIQLRAEIGLLLLKHYSRSMGERYLQGVLTQDPNHRVAHEALAEYYDRVGDVTRAQYHRRHANGS